MTMLHSTRRQRILRLARRRARQLENLESRVLLSATVSNADLHDTWTAAGISVTGSIIFDGVGNISGGGLTDTNGESGPATGTYALNSSGLFTAVLNTLHVSGGINSARDLLVYTQNDAEETLTVLVNSQDATFSNSDVNGIWNFFASTGHSGTITFDGEGDILTGLLSAGTNKLHVNGGNYNVNPDGTFAMDLQTTEDGDLSLRGALNASKDLLAVNPDDIAAAFNASGPTLAVGVRLAGTYSNASAAGTWTISAEGGGGTVQFDGAGHITGGTFLEAQGQIDSLSGTYSIAATGKLTAHIVAHSGTASQTLNFTGVMNAGHNTIVETAPGNSNITILTSAANHLPTLTSVAPLGIAAVGSPFTISYDSLVAHAVGGDLDRDDLTVHITAAGPGSLTLNGGAVSPGQTFSQGDHLVWTPPAGATGGAYTAFSMTIADDVGSSAPVTVSIDATLTQPFTTGDLINTWIVSGMGASGTISFDGAGNVTGGSLTDDSGDTQTPSGTYSVDSSGAISIADPVTGALNSRRDVAVVSDSGDHSLSVLVDVQHSDYSPSDLAGTWTVGFDGPDTNSSGEGTAIFDGGGSITGGSIVSGTDKFSIKGFYTLSPSGIVSAGITNVTDNSTDSDHTIHMHGAMNDSKDVVALSADDLQAAESNGNPQLMVLVRSAGTYSNADFKGTWSFIGDGVSGYMTFDGAGHVLNGFIQSGEDNGGESSAVTGTYTVSSAGKVTVSPTVTIDGAAQVFSLTGAMNASRNIVASNHISAGGGGGDSLTMFVNSQDRVPALTHVNPLATAVGNVPFDISFEDLLAATNATDADGDPVSFMVTPSAGATLKLDGDPAGPAPFQFSAGHTLQWTPAGTASGNITAFSIKAFDGAAQSATALPVVIKTVPAPTVSIAFTKNATETNGDTTGAGKFTVTRVKGDTTTPLTVHFTIGGTATNGTANDYSLADTFGAITQDVTIPAGKTSTTITVAAVDDAVAESNETVILTLATASGTTYLINAAKSQATVTIADNEPIVMLTAAKPAASELNGQTTAFGQFKLTRTGGSLAAPLTVSYTIAGTATNTTDYNTLTGTVTFLAGSANATINVNPVADQLLEGAETVQLTVVADDLLTPHYHPSPTKFQGTVTIADVLSSPAAIAGATKNTDFPISIDDLLAAIGVVSSHAQPITLKIMAIKSGTLKKNSSLPVVPKTTTVVSGDSLTWKPANNAVGTLAAFQLTATDGLAVSTVITISIIVV